MFQFKGQIHIKSDSINAIDGIITFEEDTVKVITEERGTYELPYSVFKQSCILDTKTDNLCIVSIGSRILVNNKAIISDVIIKVQNAVLFCEHLRSLNITVTERE